MGAGQFLGPPPPPIDGSGDSDESRSKKALYGAIGQAETEHRAAVDEPTTHRIGGFTANRERCLWVHHR